MNVIRKVNGVFGRVEEIIIAGSVLVMAVLMIANIICRLAFDFSITFTEEICKFCLVNVTFIGVSYTIRKNSIVEMSALVDLIPKKVRKWLKVVIWLITAVLLVWIANHCWDYVMSVKALSRVTPALEMPIWITLLALPIGMYLGALQSFLTALFNIFDKENIWLGSEVKLGDSKGLSSYDLPD